MAKRRKRNSKKAYKKLRKALKMNSIRINAYAKVNLSLDVIGKQDDGYHQVEMVMQQIDLSDEVLVRWRPSEPKDRFAIVIKTNKYFVPTDERNLAYKAALLMQERKANDIKGSLRIDIKKNIPVAAGLAGGSSNAAAVLHALNVLWELNLSIRELCELGSELGADVPFTILGQAKANRQLNLFYGADELKTTCALASGTGTTLRPLKSVKASVLLSKPPISVSTKEVYQGLDLEEIETRTKRPNNQKLLQAIQTEDMALLKESMENVLETYTCKKYKVVQDTKKLMQKKCPEAKVIMSGSGPSVFGIATREELLIDGYRELKKKNKETYMTKTI